MRIADVGVEFEGVRLSDPRLKERAVRMARAIAARPGASLPRAMGSESDREAAYRYLSNRRVSVARVLDSHIEATVERARQVDRILLVSDTTEFRFSSEREDLGVLSGRLRDGFVGHFTLAVTGDGRRTPLGVVALETIVRPERKGARNHFERKRDPERESLRWQRCAEQANQRLQGLNVVHVMDREADIYELLGSLTLGGSRFIIRSGQERLVEEGRLSSTVEKAPIRFGREVRLSARAASRKPANRRSHPARRSRLAQLVVSATQVTLKKPRASYDEGVPETITVNVLRVWEPEPEAGEEPVEWRLFTSEPVETQEQLEQIVDSYRARWTIEEYFKALKTGCNFEASQLESRRSLENLLALYIPVAWQLLLLRSTARDEPTRPATDALTMVQIAVLRLIAPGKPLPEQPTIADAARVVAELGGHIKSNGPPGWQVLGRGFDDLRRAEYLYTQINPATS